MGKNTHRSRVKRRRRHGIQTWLRTKLIIAMNGDVVKAAIALDFVNGHPEASEQYRHFQEWEIAQYREYCRSRGIKLG